PAPTGGLLTPATPGHSPRVAPPYDPARARALLAETGRGALEEIELAHFAQEEETAVMIAAQLEKVGLRVQRVPTGSHAEHVAAVKRSPAYIWRIFPDWPGDPAGGFLEPMFHSNTDNGLYRDGRLEQLLERALAVRDRDERLRLCREFERIWIGEQAAPLPLSYVRRLLWRPPRLTP